MPRDGKCDRHRHRTRREGLTWTPEIVRSNRRDLLRGASGVATVAASAPLLLRSSSAGAATSATLAFGAPEAVGMRSARSTSSTFRLSTCFALLGSWLGDGSARGRVAQLDRCAAAPVRRFSLDKNVSTACAATQSQRVCSKSGWLITIFDAMRYWRENCAPRPEVSAALGVARAHEGGRCIAFPEVRARGGACCTGYSLAESGVLTPSSWPRHEKADLTS